MSDFCSLETLERKEPLIGSASVAQRYVLLGWPKSRWAAKALTAPELMPLAAWAQRYDASARPNGGKSTVRLFAADGTESEVELRLFPAGIRIRTSLAAAPARLDEAFNALAAQEAVPGGEPCPRTLAICTHGKHDRCCAKFGQAAFKALCEEGARLGADVVEASHLGGHRFAATLVDLRPGQPGRMYGQLRAEEIPTLVDHMANERVWLDRYRGRIDLPDAAQVAEARALAEGAEGPMEIERIDETTYRVRWPGGDLTVRLQAAGYEGRTACGGEPTAWFRPVLAPASI